jgi:hypothetical protein
MPRGVRATVHGSPGVSARLLDPETYGFARYAGAVRLACFLVLTSPPRVDDEILEIHLPTLGGPFLQALRPVRKGWALRTAGR